MNMPRCLVFAGLFGYESRSEVVGMPSESGGSFPIVILVPRSINHRPRGFLLALGRHVCQPYRPLVQTDFVLIVQASLPMVTSVHQP